MRFWLSQPQPRLQVINFLDSSLLLLPLLPITITPFTMLTSIFFTLWLAVCAHAASHYFSLKPPGEPTTLTLTTNNMAADLATQQRVDVTLGVMSRCPDAIFAESALNSVIEQTNDKISLQFSYIGNLTAQELSIFNEDVGGVYCRHGAQECE